MSFDDFETASSTEVQSTSKPGSSSTAVSSMNIMNDQDIFNLAEAYEMDVEKLKDLINNIQEPPKTDDYPYPPHPLLTVTIFGDPKTAKTTQAFTFPGSILALGYESENNLDLPHQRMFSSTPRIRIKNFDPFIDAVDGEIKKESANVVYEASLALIRNIRRKGWKYDWVMPDGLDNFKDIAEMRMRVMAGQAAYNNEGMDYGEWRRRTDYLDQFYRELKKIARKGIIFTSQNVFQVATFGKEKGKKKVPAWKGKIKRDTTTLMYTSTEEFDYGEGEIYLRYYTLIKSDKWSGFSGRIETTLHEGKSPKLVVDKILGSEPEHKVE